MFFVSGFLVDRTGNYGSAFYSCAAGMGVGALFLGLVRPAKTGLCLGRRRNDQQTTDRDSSSQGSDEGPADFVEMDMEIDHSPAKSKPWPVWIPPHLKSKHTYPPLEWSSQRLPYTNPVQTGYKSNVTSIKEEFNHSSLHFFADHPIIITKTRLHSLCYLLKRKKVLRFLSCHMVYCVLVR